jgi:tetratricopeptide (TPR) repeat protein
MNIDYAVDLKAFRQLLRAKSLTELFSDSAIVEKIYDAALDSVGEDAYIYQQMAIHEMNRTQPDHDKCSNLLDRASQLAPKDVSIKHSIAEHRLRCVDNARTPLEQQALLKQASEIASSLRFVEDSYSHHTMVKIGLRKLQLLIDSEEEITLPTLESTVKEIERTLSDGLQKFPGDPYLLDSESRLAGFLADSKRVLEALKKAFESNTKSIFIAMRLAQCYRGQGDLTCAKRVVETALGGNAGDKKLNYLYSKLLLETGGGPEELIYHLRRSFVQGDSNYDAQLLYGRQLFISGLRAESKQLFSELGKARISSEARDRILYPLDQTFNGQITRLEAVYCFVARDGINDWIFASRASVGEQLWKVLAMGFRLSFRIGFTLKRARAFDIKGEAAAAVA